MNLAWIGDELVNLDRLISARFDERAEATGRAAFDDETPTAPYRVLVVKLDGVEAREIHRDQTDVFLAFLSGQFGDTREIPRFETEPHRPQAGGGAGSH